MPQVQEAKGATEPYFTEFAKIEREAGAPSWLKGLRHSAMDSFAEAGFPDTHQEAWRFTNVAPLAQTPFRLAQPVSGAAGLRRTFAGCFLPETAARLVLVDGYFNDELSQLSGLPAGLAVVSLQHGGDAIQRKAEMHLGRHADSASDPFVALNTAFLRDVAFVDVADGVVLERPVHIVHVRTEGAQNTVTHPRTLVLAGRGAQATVIESYVGMAEETYFTNAVTELVAGENTSIEHVRLQEEGEAAFHIGSVVAHQGRSSRWLSHSISLGARLARHDIRAVLAGEGAECTLNGLYEVRGRQHVDHHTTLDHAMPHCGSREYYRGILDGQSSAVFNGAIVVRKDAQKTDAIQSNKNLLLSEEATINTKPELQILADDVRCTHGATVGQLDADALFYLRARGIGLEAARHLLTRAFANDVIARIRFEPARERLERTLLSRLSAGWNPEEVL